jgi:L-serine dehydratase
MISVFEVFKIGIGPSSSHTVGPMKAAAVFASGLAQSGAITRVGAIEVTLFGSLAFTGRGHAKDRAVVLGLCGLEPETVDPDAANTLVASVRETNRLPLAGRRSIGFDPERAIVFDVVDPPPRHPNTLRLVARDENDALLADETWLSVGGGFILRDGAANEAPSDDASIPYPFGSGAELLARAREAGLTIAELVRANEAALRPAEAVKDHVGKFLLVMFGCIDRGLAQTGGLPGGLAVKRRAGAIYRDLVDAARRNATLLQSRKPNNLVYAGCDCRLEGAATNNAGRSASLFEPCHRNRTDFASGVSIGASLERRVDRLDHANAGDRPARP